MSFTALLTDTVHFVTRTVETDTWAEGTTDIRCRITPLSADGARRQAGDLEPGVTHIGRAAKSAGITGGQRIKRQSDDQEFEVRAVRLQDKPTPGQLIMLLAEVANAV